jgi:hypothetical protein
MASKLVGRVEATFPVIFEGYEMASKLVGRVEATFPVIFEP